MNLYENKMARKVHKSKLFGGKVNFRFTFSQLMFCSTFSVFLRGASVTVLRLVFSSFMLKGVSVVCLSVGLSLSSAKSVFLPK